MRHLVTPAIEDYVKEIYNLQKEESVSTKMIAEKMEIAPASVTNMIKRMSKLGLVDYKSHKGVTLTPVGTKVALEIIRHHRLLELYLSEVMGYSWDEVHREAEQLEHYISEQFEDTISEMLGNPKFDPHGDPIPDKNGKLPSVNSISLTKATKGKTYILRRVIGQHPDLLRYLTELGIKPNIRFFLKDIAPFNGPVTITINNGSVSKSGELVIYLGEEFRESEQEEGLVTYPSSHSSKTFDLGIEGFCRGIGRSVVKEV